MDRGDYSRDERYFRVIARDRKRAEDELRRQQLQRQQKYEEELQKFQHQREELRHMIGHRKANKQRKCRRTGS